MLKSSLIALAVLSLSATFCIVVPSGCANIIPPAGGARDTLPPVLLSASPKDSTLNFKGDRIVLTFDEYIGDLADIPNNLLFSPTFEVSPEMTVHLKTITIRFRDSLLPKTTYILNFGSAIRDINENNAIKNYVYTFSTGATLDSLSLSGKVVLSETGNTDSTLLVMLHRSFADSAVIKERPLYIAKVDADGRFRFTNLPSAKYAIYALGDAGTIRRYQNKTQYFAFSNDTVITGVTNNVLLYAYREEQAKAPTAQTSLTRGTTANDRRLRFTPPQGNLDLQSDYVLNFSTPIRKFDSLQVSLTSDSTFTPVGYTIALDSAKTALRFRSKWKEGTRYNLILNKEFAEDTTGRKLLKSDTLNFTTKKQSDYGQLKLTVRNLDKNKNPVLLFVQNNQVVYSAPIKNGNFIATLFNPGEYELRILYDANNNGKWDPGHFFGVKKQPEIVQAIRENISVKAAWENEFERSL